MGENPVTYIVQLGNDLKSKIRELHRNLLLLCDSSLYNFDWDLNLDNVQSTKQKKRKKKE